MANKVYFVSESTFKENTTVNLNVEPSLINLAIYDAQILHLQMALGSILYRKLETLIKTNDITKSENAKYKTLLDDYVQPAVIQWAFFECIPYIRYKVMNKSVSGQSSDNSTPIDLEELKFLQSSLRNKAEFYSQRVADYLLSNSTLFPEYTESTDIDDIHPEHNQYFSGLQLDDCEDYCSLDR